MIKDTDRNDEQLVYRVTRAEQVAPPSGMPNAVWYRYVISRGSSVVHGLKPGSLKSVTEHAEAEVAALNDRIQNKRGAHGYRSRKHRIQNSGAPSIR